MEYAEKQWSVESFIDKNKHARKIEREIELEREEKQRKMVKPKVLTDTYKVWRQIDFSFVRLQVKTTCISFLQ